MEANAFWVTAPYEVELRKEVVNSDTGEIPVEAAFSGVSSGTERIIYEGKVPKEIYHEMSVPYQKGSFDLPIKYGYSLVGKVVAGKRAGEFVHVMHPHQDQIMVKQSDVTFLPRDIPLQKAVLLSNMETALTGVWDSRISPGDKVGILGFGTIGTLISMIIRDIPGVEMYGYDLEEQRVKAAGVKGIDEEKNFDIVFDCTGSGRSLQKAIDLIGFEGKVVDLSWYGTQELNLSLGGSFHRMRKQIISSQVSSIPSWKTHRWDFSRRKKVSLELLKRVTIPSLEVKFEELPQRYDEILYRHDVASKVVKY